VLAAGIPAEWLYNAANAEVGVRRLPTAYGVLDYSLRAEGQEVLKLSVGGGLVLPPGGLRIRPPAGKPIKSVKLNGAVLSSFAASEVRIAAVPAELEIRY
ncbi:MAG: hypothetical protein PHT19_12690, partial [Methylococcus sp.]|nr:hypothetical protein [Methylococcus sp.]